MDDQDIARMNELRARETLTDNEKAELQRLERLEAGTRDWQPSETAMEQDAAVSQEDREADPRVDPMARVALAVLQAEGHAHAVLNDVNPLIELRKMVAQRLYDPPVAAPDGAERLVYAVVDAMRQERAAA